jgi:tape measure domain-containing protein
MADNNSSISLSIGGDSSGLSSALNTAEKDLQELATAGQKVRLLEAAEQNAKDFAIEIERARQKVQTLQTTISEAYASGGDNKLISDLTRQLSTAERESNRATAAFEKNSQSLFKLKIEARAAGVDIHNLTAEKDRINQTAQAASALSNAFKTLGVKPLRDVREETQRLQSALATIKSTGIIGPEQERAVAAFKTKLAELRAETASLPAATAGAKTAMAGLATETNSVGAALGGAAHKALAWGGALAGLNGISGLAAGVIETGAAFETLEARLSSLLGSTEAAKDAMANIKALAISTPFEVSALSESFVKLTAFGLQPSMAQMQALADTAATLGGGTEALAGVTLALGQAWAKGKLQGDEILQLAERGVPIWDVLAQATGKNTAELQKMSEAGELGRGTILKLIDALGQMNAGASDKMMATFSGAVSNAKDALAEFYDMIAKAGVLDFLTGQLQDLLAEFNRLKETGELDAAAQRMASSFIALAEGVKTAGQAVNALSGVIELGLEVWVAWRLSAMTLIPLLGGVGTASALAATQAGALATTSTAAAVGMTGLATAVRLVKGLTLVGLLEGVISLGAEFFRAKKEAEDADRAIKKAMAAPKDTGAKDAIKAVATETEAARIKLTEYQAAMGNAMAQGKSTGDALADMVKKADFDSPKGISDLLRGLDSVRQGAQATGEEIKKSLQDRLNKMTGEDLRDFGIMAQSAFDQGRISAQQLADSLNGQVDAALKGLGSSLEVSAGGMTAKFSEVAEKITVVETAYERLAATGLNASAVLKAAFEGGLNTAKSEQDLEALAAAIRRSGEAGRLSKQEVADFLDTIKQKVDAAIPGINSMSEAFKTLGMKSQEELNKTARSAEDAFNTIKSGSDYSAAGLANTREAFKRMAEASIAANGGIASDSIKARAGLYGLKIEADNAGKAVVGLADSTRESGAAADRASGSYAKAATSLDRVATSAGNARTALASYQQMVDAGMSQSQISNVLSDRNTNDVEKSAGIVKRNVTTDSIDWRTEALRKGATSEQADEVARIIGDKITVEMDQVRQSYQGATSADPASYRYAINGAYEQAFTEAMNEASSGTSKSGTTSGLTPAGQTTTVNINLAGKTTAVKVASAADATALTTLFKQLESDAGRAY